MAVLTVGVRVERSPVRPPGVPHGGDGAAGGAGGGRQGGAVARPSPLAYLMAVVVVVRPHIPTPHRIR